MTSLHLRAFIYGAFLSFVFLASPVSAEVDPYSDAALNDTKSNIDISADPLSFLQAIRQTATFGIKTATKGIRAARGVLLNSDRKIKTIARNILRGLKKSSRVLKNVRKRFIKRSRRVIAIARSGRTPPQALSDALAQDTVRILELEAEIQQLRAEIELLKVQQQLGL